MGVGKRPPEPLEDIFDVPLELLLHEDIEELAPMSSERQRLALKRRRAEARLEQKRLRDELGDYDLEFDDF